MWQSSSICNKRPLPENFSGTRIKKQKKNSQAYKGKKIKCIWRVNISRFQFTGRFKRGNLNPCQWVLGRFSTPETIFIFLSSPWEEIWLGFGRKLHGREIETFGNDSSLYTRHVKLEHENICMLVSGCTFIVSREGNFRKFHSWREPQNPSVFLPLPW